MQCGMRRGQAESDETAGAEHQQCGAELQPERSGEGDLERDEADEDAADRLAQTSTWRRLHRSSSDPANGPISEYGSSMTANPSAMSIGVAAFSGLNSTEPTSAPWNAPSPAELTIRTATSNRSRRTRSNDRSPCADGGGMTARSPTIGKRYLRGRARPICRTRITRSGPLITHCHQYPVAAIRSTRPAVCHRRTNPATPNIAPFWTERRDGW